MIQDSVTLQNRHHRFVRTICENGIVYSLENEAGFASSSSIHFEDEKGNAVGIICFWAEKALAKSCIKDDWSDYKIIQMSLSEFIEDWCVGMENDGLLIGTEFDPNMFGYVAEPLELILELVNELEKNNKDLKFEKFNNISDIKIQVERLLE